MSRLLPRSLRAQLLLVTLAALAIAQGLSLWLFADERALAVQAALVQETAGRAANVALLLETANDAETTAIQQAANSPLVRFSLASSPAVERSDQGGQQVATLIAGQLGRQSGDDVRVETRANSAAPAPLPQMQQGMRRMNMGMDRMAMTAVEMSISIRLQRGGWLNVDTRFHRPPLQRAWRGIATFTVTAALIALALWVALGRLTGPLRRLAEMTGRFGRGEPTEALTATGPEELRNLTRAFNDMQDRIRRFVDDRTRLLAALGHDLRSPLTALRVRAEMVEDDENRERLVATVEEMQHMVEATLSFARGMAANETAETLDLGGYVAALASEMAEAGEAVTYSPTDRSIKARLRPTATRRALRNLIANAARYGERARVSVQADHGGVAVIIDDDGPGIAQDDMARVFDPFVRLETSRSRETGGTGLGLSIAQSIVQAQGGSIRLENRPDGGLRATVTLPMDAATANVQHSDTKAG
jgi:signal transduction histidine kinase